MFVSLQPTESLHKHKLKICEHLVVRMFLTSMVFYNSLLVKCLQGNVRFRKKMFARKLVVGLYRRTLPSVTVGVGLRRLEAGHDGRVDVARVMPPKILGRPW